MPLCVFPKCFIPSFLQGGPYTLEWWMTAMAREVGVDGVELYGPALPQSPEAITKIGELAASLGLRLPMYCHTPDFTQPEPGARRKEVDAQKRAIEVCRNLGIGFCRVLSGQRRSDVSIEHGLEYAAGCINELVPFARETGVCLVLENHYKDAHWEFPEFAQKRDVFRRLLECIPHSTHFGVNFDPSNALVAGDDPVDFLREFIGRVRTMHASDRFLVHGTLADLQRADEKGHVGYASNLRHGVIGEGLIDYPAIFSLLRENRFDGWISIENGNDPEKGVEHIRRSAVFLRDKMKTYGIA